MKSIVKYDKSQLGLTCENSLNIPKYCENCIVSDEKKCKKFYEKLLEKREEGIYRCPYGFYSYYLQNNIYTCFLIKSDIKQASNNLINSRQKTKDFKVLDIEQVTDLMDDFKKIMSENIELKDCMHDLRNIGGYFNSMSEKIAINHKDLTESDEDIRAIIALYDLVNYRLNVFYGLDNLETKIIKAPLYPLMKRLKVMLQYQARKKKVKIFLKGEQSNILLMSKNIYLAMFILLENAVKHAKSNSEIIVSFDENEDETIVSIINESNIIEKYEESKLFERGYRGINAVSKGSGIGLNLVKNIFDNVGYVYDLKINDKNHDTSLFTFSINFNVTKK